MVEYNAAILLLQYKISVCKVPALGQVSNFIPRQVLLSESSARGQEYLPRYKGSRSRGSSEVARPARVPPKLRPPVNYERVHVLGTLVPAITRSAPQIKR
jgi:hypothetical protein